MIVVLKIIGFLIAAYSCSIIYVFVKGYLRYRRLKAQGVVFPWGFNALKVRKAFEQARKDNLHAFEILPMLKRTLGENMPPAIGIPVFADVVLLILDSSTSQQIFIDKNKFNSKHVMTRDAFRFYFPRTLLFTATEEPDYAQRRKIVTAAFFKQRLIEMTYIIKQVCQKKILQLHEQIKKGESTINLVDTTQELYADIIISCSVGLVLARDMV